MQVLGFADGRKEQRCCIGAIPIEVVLRERKKLDKGKEGEEGKGNKDQTKQMS